MSTAVLSFHADFEPEGSPADLITWTFYARRDVAIGAGIYELRFVRTLEEHEHGEAISGVLGAAQRELAP